MRVLWKTGEKTRVLGKSILGGTMEIALPQAVKTILNQLHNSGQEAYAVGGCVRDTILGREPQDWDITTSATPEQIKAIFQKTVDTGIQHGTVTVLIDRVGYEVTTYRIDGEYEDARHPKEVIFTASLLEDLKRRDFTINAMAYNEQDGLVDAFDGVGDLKRGVIRCVGDAKERFGEDALRMLRAVRFAAQLGFVMEAQTRQAIEELAVQLKKVSAERIQVELTKLLVSAHPEEMRALYETGISAVILPEWNEMMETPQNNPHHSYYVGEHTVRALMVVRPDKVLRYTVLLHDVAKPACRTTDEKGIDHFYHHPERGAKMAQSILRRLKMDVATIEAVCALVRHHDRNPALDARSVRKTIYRAGRQQYPALFEIKRADILAQSDYQRQKKLDNLAEYERLYNEIIEREECLSLKELAVNGADLIEAGMKPGKEIGEVLKQLLELVIEDPEKNTKEYLMRYTLENLFI